MRTPLLGALLVTAVFATGSFAQDSGQVNGDPATQPATTPPQGSDEVARGYANPAMPHQGAINAGGQADTAALNNSVAAADQQAQASNAANRAISQADKAQYDADRSAYMDALVAHDHAVNRADARYQRQQVAYANAMAAWRLQVAACKRGHQRACDMPPPNPASFY